MAERDLLGGLVRLHVLYHATREPVYGQAIIDELAHHGYRLSPGTLYPVLHGLERGGYLKSRLESDGGRSRRIYRATAAGRKSLQGAKAKVWELFRELFEEELAFGAEGKYRPIASVTRERKTT